MAVVEIPTKVPDHDVIEVLEKLLAQARSGELQSFAYVSSYGNYLTGNGWAGMGKNNMAIVGELVALQHDIVNSGAVELRWQPICDD